jgi:hypothetical protein
MKKLFFSFLLLAGTGVAMHAQTASFSTQTESIFNYPKPGSTKVNFYFWYQKNNRVVLEMNDVRQLNLIPNLDSLVQAAFHAIKPLKDSFKNDGLVRRIDYMISSTLPPQIRITTHPRQGESFSYYKEELVSTKIEKDTLRIRINVPKPQPVNKMPKQGVFIQSFVIMLLVDNFDDLTAFPTNALEECVKRVKKDLGKNLTTSKNLTSNFRAYYNMQTDKMFSPLKPKYMSWGKKEAFEPTVQLGLQYARGSFVPSAGAGLQYRFSDGIYSQNFIRAYWEPYFFFSRDDNNKLVTDRNDFITLRYTVLFLKEKPKTKITTSGNISLSYLVGRRGSWFESNTFKVGTPGFMAGSLMFEPEFFFNNAFRNFSPSLKMTLMFE